MPGKSSSACTPARSTPACRPFWDGGVTVWVGDPSNGKLAEATFLEEEFEQVGEWLDREARKLFPDSDYAKG